MYSASLIAAAIVQKAIDEGDPVTQMKLQKMVYFANGYNLAKRDQKLIEEDFQAWKFGPVVPTIYNDYQLYGNMAISNFDKSRSIYGSLGFDESSLGEDAKDAINYTWKATAHLSAADLSKWTHKEDGPWAKVYNQLEPSIKIDDNDIKAYFKNFLYS
ncbi:Uncharacterized phage-associated protein [Mucilaginibacter mallensis]|uniref:Uncharacterized phage-associated protein n=1 Tax=Mucilaginibacter mallensis TaxID=652787 RepID=A0A1H1MIE1_MUCMA|nr:type II toxin-antitoxin system antitoxin SocA domain-containing protein [Mucilaginibacter mallensis]SDR86601.1 Uncharacterized phage-associated protein [Mucilaginibacter mallensis]